MNKRPEFSVIQRVGFALFGAYLIVGAVFSFASGRWFPGFPPQLDIAAFLTGGSSSPTAVYLEATLGVLLAFGCLCIALNQDGDDSRQEDGEAIEIPSQVVGRVSDAAMRQRRSTK